MEFVDESLDYVLPLAAHMVIADEQVHDRELAVLDALAGRYAISQGARTYARRIVEGADDAQPFPDALAAVPPQHRDAALRALVAIALADRVLVSAERQMLVRAAQHWAVSPATLERYLDAARKEIDALAQVREEPEDAPSFAARVVAGVDSLFGQRGTDIFGGLIGAKERVRQLRREFLLSGPEYDEAIAACAAVARSDLVRCDAEMRTSMEALDEVIRDLHARTSVLARDAGRDAAVAAKEASGLIRDTAVRLESELRHRLERFRLGLHAKEGTVGSFTIAFMGRTKSGKTTLHAVLSGEGHEAIGVGKQRTTRFNRVYHWKNVRVVDTPGIGAPGGKSDTEIAESIVDEADLVCYVVTNDSQQATELDFLGKLRNRAKPVVILLNVKGNLRHPRKLDRYLANPDKELKGEGTRGVPGHVQRIRRYVDERLGGVPIEIVPVHLLAAQMAAEPDHAEHAHELRAASGIDSFLDRLRVSIIEHGTLRRSQTLLGCSSADLHESVEWLRAREGDLRASIEVVAAQRREVARQLKRAATDSRRRLQIGVDAAYTRALRAVGSFAESNWDAKQEALDRNWRAELDRIGLATGVDEAREAALNEYRTRIHEALDEAGRELEAFGAIAAASGQASEQKTGTLTHDILKWVSRVSIAAGVVAGVFFATNPVGWILGGIGVAASLLKLLFKSSAKRRAEAVAKIREGLRDSVSRARLEALDGSLGAFDEMSSATTANVLSYFDTVLAGLQGAVQAVEGGARRVRASAARLDLRFAERVTEWVAHQTAARPQVLSVDRRPGAEMLIHVDRIPSNSRRAEELGRLLLERVQFVNGSRGGAAP